MQPALRFASLKRVYLQGTLEVGFQLTALPSTFTERSYLTNSTVSCMRYDLCIKSKINHEALVLVNFYTFHLN